jgi:small subunit ribosomal protein S1
MSTEPSNEPTPTADTSAPRSAEPAPAEAADAPAHEGEDAAEAAGEGEAAEGGEASAEGAPGAPKKKRRRRRKKKPAGEGQPAEAQGGAEGEKPAEGAEAKAEKKRDKRREARPQEPRERPAFNVGDVVFGKIVELGEDAIFIDLSGKGRAIFDRHELQLPDEPAQGPGSELDDDEDDRPLEEVVAEGKAILAGEGAAKATAGAEATTGEAATPSVDAAPAVEAAPVADAPAGAAEPPKPAKPDVPVVTLPPVVEEVGANFVGVVHNDGGRGGLVVLTRHPHRVRRTKPLVALAFKEKTLVKGLVTGAIKGGVEVDVDGLRAFAPASHVDLRHGADLRALVGKRLEFAVTQYGKRGRDVVLSRKDMLETEAKARRAEALTKLVPGTVVEGVVRAVVPFGAFVDVGGVEGLVPLSEMSHNRADRPEDVFEVGQPVSVLVQRIDVKGKIWLSRKATQPDPWLEAVKKYEVGTRHRGKVVRIQPFGAFVELEPGIDGLMHVADFAVGKPIKDPSEVVKIGDEVDVIVGHVDADAHKIALHPIPPGWSPDEPRQKVALHKVVKVVVTAVEAAGLQVRILGATGRSARGFITGAGTGTPRGTELRKVFPVGSQHEAKVIDVDPRRGEVKLSIKAVSDDNERSAYKQYRQQVTREAKFGTLGDIIAAAQKKDEKPS